MKTISMHIISQKHCEHNKTPVNKHDIVSKIQITDIIPLYNEFQNVLEISPIQDPARPINKLKILT